MSRIFDISGKRYGNLFVIEPTEARKNKSVVWKCICNCGNHHFATSHNLQQGNCKMCKSCKYKYISQKRTKHGKSRTPLYRTWISMIDRCSENSEKKQNYFERGIKVCNEWIGIEGLERFIKDVGNRPSKEHSLDRINNDGNYEPSNVRWATKSQQMKNRRPMSSINKFTDQQLLDEVKRRGLL